MQKIILMHQAYLSRLASLSTVIILFTFLCFTGCGGGGGNGPNSKKSSSHASTSTSVILSGKITYDYVPHNSDFIGLDYTATERRPVRGAMVELLDSVGEVKAFTSTTSDGAYSVAVEQNIFLKVRVKAQLLNNSSPSWDFKVTDNTANNALYVLEGSLASSGTTDSVRDLHASSGWDGFGYPAPRSAAPFAILDSIYVGLMRVTSAGNTKSLRPLELRWSTKNSAADGDYTMGEIGTSFYDGSAIYILGDANYDIDEYDPHVLLHEWGHYLEDELFRSDSIGGDHADGKFLDMRVAMSEGFANAFSGIVIDRANYSDASGVYQASGFTFDIAKKSRINKGYFSEGSISSILYNFYASDENKTANDFKPLFQILSSASYYTNEAMISIYVFYSELRKQIPQYVSVLQALMREQSIWGEDEYGANESNSGGLAIQLPIYKEILVNGYPTRICSSNQYGEQNKLGNSQFVKLNITQAVQLSVHVEKSVDINTYSKPEFFIYLRGAQVGYAENIEADKVSTSIKLSKGNYVLEIYDKIYRDNENSTSKNTSCFDVYVIAN
ncbi:MAG: hypothetical protein EOO52_08965 [Gammaproteobacteria bacterium]|nr:MAG: hypothetical protein EOO52_08965 [Gammaproteobacteria bacterium]